MKFLTIQFHFYMLVRQNWCIKLLCNHFKKQLYAHKLSLVKLASERSMTLENQFPFLNILQFHEEIN